MRRTFAQLLSTATLFAAAPGLATTADTACTSMPPVIVDADATERQTIAKIESALLMPIIAQNNPSQTLTEAMASANVPGVSVALVENGRIAWAAAWGVSSLRTCAQMTPQTRLQTASISKPVAAVTALVLAEKGKLDLDAPVAGTANGWGLPRADGVSGFPNIRQLLSHTGGVTVHGFAGYVPGQPVPTTATVLAGEPPANSEPVKVAIEPGMEMRYSGGGYTLVQQLIADADGDGFDAAAQRHVIGPAGMRHSGYAVPIPALRAAGHFRGSAIDGDYRIHPEHAAAGLWTTPTDLARFAISIQRAFAGSRGGSLSPESARMALTPVKNNYGLGFETIDDAEGGRFGHDGVNFGFESKLIAGRSNGRAIAIMTNGQGGRQLADALTMTIADAVGWSALSPRRVVEVPMSEAERAQLVGHYDAPGWAAQIEAIEDKLRITVNGDGVGRLIPMGHNRFAFPLIGVILAVSYDEAGAPKAITVVDGGPPLVLQRVASPMLAIGTVPMFVRGSMNEWGISAPLAKIDGGYAADLALDAGAHMFKIASEDWSTVDLGSQGGPASLTPGDVLPLASRAANIGVTIPHAGSWRVMMDMTDPMRPTVSVLPR